MCDLYAYEPPVSLWSLVVAHVKESEAREIKFMLGESMVEQSIELHDEISTLLEIWRDLREESAQATPLQTRLPEPPAVRDRLKEEIKFFVTNLEEKARLSGRSVTEVLAKHNTEILDYALDAGYSSSRSRPSTARSSRDGRETPVVRHTPDSARFSMASSVNEEIEEINDKLNINKFGEVVKNLRHTLEEEVNQLLKDIEFLQSCLDDEANFQDESHISREPTLTELREQRSKLEKELLSTETSPLHESLHESSRAPPRRPSIQGKTALGPIKTPPSSASKLRPLKANHSLSMPIAASASVSSPDDSSEGKLRMTVRKNGQFAHRTDLQKLTDNVSHMTIRTATSPSQIEVTEAANSSHVPVPPNSAKPSSAGSRPRSAQRFRKMVLDCREGPT